MAAAPDATRDELRQQLNIDKDARTIGRWLTQLGLVLKKSRCMPLSKTART